MVDVEMGKEKIVMIIMADLVAVVSRQFEEGAAAKKIDKVCLPANG